MSDKEAATAVVPYTTACSPNRIAFPGAVATELKQLIISFKLFVVYSRIASCSLAGFGLVYCGCPCNHFVVLNNCLAISQIDAASRREIQNKTK